MDVIKSITQEYEKSDIPAFGVGDTVKVHIKIKEGNRERVQIFEGFVLKKQRNLYRQKDLFGSRRREDFPAALA